ncbi:MAG TPA: Na+/H+ antiporter NhaC family protein [Longimicrobiales bacterium]|nr:Na+/H+ antiporter NhaC family protein [Longimicrobiales bacterium]
MTDPTWISLLPPVLAIVLAIWSRQVYLSLAGGVWLGWTIMNGWNPLVGLAVTIEELVAVLGEPGDAKVILFTLVIGAMIATIEVSGGVKGFTRVLEERALVKSAKGAQLLAWVTGFIIFIESNITVLVAGSVARPLMDRYRSSREKLAYIIDSTSAPICILIPMNAWGAYNIGILESLGVQGAVGVFVTSIAFNFYAIAAVTLALVVVLFDWNVGPMKKAEARAATGQVMWEDSVPVVDESVLSPETKPGVEPLARDMIVPITVMVLTMPFGLWVTGGGNLLEGSGSTSVLWAVTAGLFTSWALLLARRAFNVDELMKTALKGAGGLVPLALILLLSLAMKNVAAALETGPYVAQLVSGGLPLAIFLPLAFIVSGGIAFSIGTSWGTFGIMLPIVVPAAAVLGLPLAPFVAAALAGGIFGDHCSPISDTTIISSMAAATDHIDHVRTQLPYALTGGLIATIGFAITGALL